MRIAPGWHKRFLNGNEIARHFPRHTLVNGWRGCVGKNVVQSRFHSKALVQSGRDAHAKKLRNSRALTVSIPPELFNMRRAIEVQHHTWMRPFMYNIVGEASSTTIGVTRLPLPTIYNLL